MIRQFFPAEDERDFKALKAAYLRIRNLDEAIKFTSYTMMPPDEERISDWLRSHNEHGIDYLVDLDADETIRGICVTKADNRGFEILALLVDPDFRREGIGSNLTLFAIEQARKDGYRAIDISVYVDNKAMLLLVIKLDFIPVGLTHHVRADGADTVQFKSYL